MKRLVPIILLLLVTGGITYALRTGVLRTGADDRKEGRLPPTGKPNQQARLSEGKTERQSKKRKGKRQSRGRRISVKVADVRTGEVQETLSYVGSLLPRTSVRIFSKVEGRIERIFVNVGSLVKEGDLIARIENDEITEEVREAEALLRVAQATLKGKEAEMKNVERQLERSQRLFKKNFISQQDLDTVETQHYSAEAQTELARARVAQREAALENARIRLRNTEIRSPITGYVWKKPMDRGAIAKTNISTDPIVRLVEIDPITTLISVVEKDYRKIKPGLTATIRVDAYPGRSFTGKIARVSPVLDADTRTADVEIEIPNFGKELKPGMFARVEIVAQKRRGALLVPEGALLKVGEGHGVFKLSKKGSKVKLVPVKIGLNHKGWVEVQGSLKSGDRVVTLGSGLLRDGQGVEVIEAALGASSKGDGA